MNYLSIWPGSCGLVPFIIHLQRWPVMSPTRASRSKEQRPSAWFSSASQRPESLIYINLILFGLCIWYHFSCLVTLVRLGCFCMILFGRVNGIAESSGWFDQRRILWLELYTDNNGGGKDQIVAAGLSPTHQTPPRHLWNPCRERETWTCDWIWMWALIPISTQKQDGPLNTQVC